MAALTHEDKEKWGYQKTCDFITLYKQHECLYNSKIKEYKDKQKRWMAIQKIARELEVTESEITEKINCLRSQYTRERRKLTENPKYNPPWVHFEALQFLHDHTRRRTNLPHRSRSREVGEENGFDDTGIQVIVEEPTSSDTEEIVLGNKRLLLPPSKMSKKRRPTRRQTLEEEENEMLRKAMTIIDSASTPSEPSQLEMDADDLFGQYISSELKTIADPFTKKFIKHQIQTILFEGQLSPHARQQPSGATTFRTLSLRTLTDQAPAHGEALSFNRTFASSPTGSLGASDPDHSDVSGVSHHSGQC